MDTYELASILDGELLHPGDDGFDEARQLWNVRFDRTPSFIARCEGVADIVASINFARQRGVKLSVKGGGHSYAANSVADGGLLLDLSRMKDVQVDPESRIVVR